MKTFKQFIIEVEAKSVIQPLSPYKTMGVGTTDEKGNIRYIKRLFKKLANSGGITPKMYDPKTDLPYIRTLPVRKDSVDKFRKGTGFNLPIPLAKRKDVTPKEMNKYQKGINDKYKQITNPVKSA